MSPEDLIDAKGNYKMVFGTSEEAMRAYAQSYVKSGEIVDCAVISDEKLKPVHACLTHETDLGGMSVYSLNRGILMLKVSGDTPPKTVTGTTRIKEGIPLALGHAKDLSTLTRVIVKRA